MSSIFVTNIHHDTHVGFSELMEGFDAVFISTSLTEPHSWGWKGKNTCGKDPSAGQRVAVMVAATSPLLGRQVSYRYLNLKLGQRGLNHGRKKQSERNSS